MAGDGVARSDQEEGEVINRVWKSARVIPGDFARSATPQISLQEGISGWACEQPHQSLYIIAAGSKNAFNAAFWTGKRDNK